MQITVLTIEILLSTHLLDGTEQEEKNITVNLQAGT